MQTLWKLSQDGNSASRTLDNGSFESRLVVAIPTLMLDVSNSSYWLVQVNQFYF
jgi:hypothetical protein